MNNRPIPLFEGNITQGSFEQGQAEQEQPQQEQPQQEQPQQEQPQQEQPQQEQPQQEQPQQEQPQQEQPQQEQPQQEQPQQEQPQQEQPEQEQPEQEQPEQEQMLHAVSKLQDGISMLGSKLTALEKDFAAKLKYDASKQQIIDRQHEELERFRCAQAEKVSRAIINDVIQEIDDVEKTHKFYANAESTPENYAKLLKLCMDYSESLRDLLERHDVYAFRSETGSQFCAKRQRAMRTVPVADETCSRTIQESLRWGFEDESGKVIRPEMVNVYVYQQPDADHSAD